MFGHRSACARPRRVRRAADALRVDAAAHARCRRHRRRGASPSQARINEPTPPGSAEPTGSDLTTVPTACIGLGADDCRRVVAQVATIVPPGSSGDLRPGRAVRLRRGPGMRPVTRRAAAGRHHARGRRRRAVLPRDRVERLRAHHRAPGRVRRAARARVAAAVTAGARPFSLGHCGLWSGIDSGGSWWDPVGPVDGDHPDAINAADGTLSIQDPDRRNVHVEGRPDRPAGPSRGRQVPATLPVRRPAGGRWLTVSFGHGPTARPQGPPRGAALPSRWRRHPGDHVGHRPRPGHQAPDEGLLGIPGHDHGLEAHPELRRLPAAVPLDRAHPELAASRSSAPSTRSSAAPTARTTSRRWSCASTR